MLAGIAEVVAPLGTALTEQQAALIRKYTKNVFLLYDSDQAGLKATFRAGDMLLATGIVGSRHLAARGRGSGHVRRQGRRRGIRARGRALGRRVRPQDSDSRARRLVRRPAPQARGARQAAADDSRHVGPAHARPVHRADDARWPASRARCCSASCDAPRPRTARSPGRAGRARRRTRQIAGRTRRRTVAADQAPVAASRAERELVRVLLHRRRYVEPVARTTWRRSALPIRPIAAIFIELTSDDPEAPIDELAASLDEDATLACCRSSSNETGGLDHARGNASTRASTRCSSRSIAERLTRDRSRCCRSRTRTRRTT